MLKWICANIGTITISIMLTLLVTFIISRLISNKKKGKSSCCGNCEHCSLGGGCNR